MRQVFLEIIRDAKQVLLEETKRKRYFFSNRPLLQDKPKIIHHPQPLLKPIEQKTKLNEPKVLQPLLQKTHAKEETTKIDSKNEKTEIPASQSTQNEFDSHLRTAIEKACPHLKLKDFIPSDKEALQRKNAWKERSVDVEILILEMSSNPKHMNLLANMAKALLSLGKKVQVVETGVYEKENGWEAFLTLPQLNLVIAPPLEEWKTPLLQERVIINTTTNEARLGPAKLIFLPPLENLLSDLQLKLKVWKWLLNSLQA